MCTNKTIDIDSLLRSKMGDKANMVPRFLANWLKRILHEDEVNAFLWESRNEKGVPWLQRCVEYLGMNLQVEGMENLPPANDGRRYTFVSNHPLGGIDGVALGALIGKHYDGNFSYLVRDELMFLPGLAPLCIPINKTGKQSRAFPAMVEAGFASDKHMLMFPAGLCSRRQKDGTIRDIPLDKDFRGEINRNTPRHHSHTFRRTELRQVLPHRKPLQGAAHKIQHRNAVPCR